MLAVHFETLPTHLLVPMEHLRVTRTLSVQTYNLEEGGGTVAFLEMKEWGGGGRARQHFLTHPFPWQT